MTNTVILNDFKKVSLWRNRFRRSEYQIWDANLHHGDVRPFACPELICSRRFRYLYPLNSCECAGVVGGNQTVIGGFCKDQHFSLLGRTLTYISTSQICSGASLGSYLAGVPTPRRPYSATFNCEEEDCDNVGYSYVVTYITEDNGVIIEGSPSPPSEIVMLSNPPNIPIFFNPSLAEESAYGVIGMRLYRAESMFEDGTDAMSEHGSEYVYVDDVPLGTARYDDTLLSSETGAPLTTYEPMAFPAPRGEVIAMTKTLDGIVVASKHRVYISIPGQPMFSWDGVVEIEDEIIDIVSINNTIFVLTNNKPVKIGYRHTDGVMSIDKQIIERRLPLLSKKSVSVYDGKVFFSSTHSLYAWDISGYGSDISSSLTSLMTPEQWANIDPTTVVGTAYEFGYILNSANINYSLMIEFGGDRTDTINGTSIIPISYINNVNSFALNYEGHIMYSSNTGTYKWDWRRRVNQPLDIHDHIIPSVPNSCDCCPWKIRMYFDNEGKNRFSKMRIEWDERSATHLDANFYHGAFGTEELIGSFEVVSSRGFSTPKYLSSQTVCVEVSGCGIMHEIRLATSNQELVSNSNNLKGNT